MTTLALEMEMQQVSHRFTQKVIGVHGEAGADWLSRLAEIIAECQRLWSLRVLPPFTSLSYNYVAPAVYADGTDAVLKLGVPSHEIKAEIEALRVFDGLGIVRMFESDFDLGAMLLERLKPGEMVSNIKDDEQATSITARVMKRLWRPQPPEHSFPTITEWAAGLDRLRGRFDGGTGPFPAHLVQQAETLFSELIATMGEPVLLH